MSADHPQMILQAWRIVVGLLRQRLQSRRVAEDHRVLGPPLQRLGYGPGRPRHGAPVVGDVLVVRVLGALQLPGADVAQHDAEGEEAEEADHQQDEQQLLRLRAPPGGGRRLLQSIMGSVVPWRLEAAAVEAVLQDGEQQRLQLGAVEAEHRCPLLATR